MPALSEELTKAKLKCTDGRHILVQVYFHPVVDPPSPREPTLEECEEVERTWRKKALSEVLPQRRHGSAHARM